MRTVLITFESLAGRIDVEVPGELSLRELIALLPPEVLPAPIVGVLAQLVVTRQGTETLPLDLGLIAANVMDGTVLVISQSNQRNMPLRSSERLEGQDQQHRPSLLDRAGQIIPGVVEGWEPLS